MIRTNAKPERSAKMSGIDWSQYYPRMHENRDWLLQQPHEEVGILSHDGLKLHGTYFPGPGNKVVICSMDTPATVWASTPSLGPVLYRAGALAPDHRPALPRRERGQVHRLWLHGPAGRSGVDPLDGR